MNHKGNLVIQALVFLVLWAIAGILWSLIFDGALVVILGCITSLAIIGVIYLIFYFDR